MSMESHVTTTLRSVYYQLQSISGIHQYLDHSSCASVVNALVTSRIDYFNSLLVGLSENVLRRLQVVQNHAAHLVSGTARRQHITPILMNLHWLPVKVRIDFKILVLAYQCIHGTNAPVYLKELLHMYRPGRNLRSSDDPTRLCVPVNNRSDGMRSFFHFAPRLWNELPHNLRECVSLSVFKRALKTFLFQKYYVQ